MSVDSLVTIPEPRRREKLEGGVRLEMVTDYAPAGDQPTAIAEIAEAEKTLAGLETELRSALRQKARLAAMGEGLAKVSHDLRNLLTTAQLLADRLPGSASQRAQRQRFHCYRASVSLQQLARDTGVMARK